MGNQYDLIYANHQFEELGILLDYNVDLDVADAKDFVIKTTENVLDIGYYWFIANSEYGGIIDKVSVSTKDDTLTYSGRSFRGILNSKIIEVPDTKSYITGNGNITDEINNKLAACAVDSLFVCDSAKVSPSVKVLVNNYMYVYNCGLYDGINGLAHSLNMKLQLLFNQTEHKIHIIPTLVNDYSDYLTYTKDNGIDVKIENAAAAVNHLVCVNTDADGNRKTIHLFTDVNGGVQQYSTIDIPLEDKDYILDKSKQVLTGIDEIVKVYDNSGSKGVTNYKLLVKSPSNWLTNYPLFFYKETDEQGNDEYKAVESIVTDTYSLLSAQPTDWATSCENYYTLSQGEYSSVSKVNTVSSYTPITSIPSDWYINYGSYYSREWDGTQYVYTNISGISQDYYVIQTAQPTEWTTNYGSYYVKNGDDYEAVAAEDNVIPEWSKNKYYTKYTNTLPATFVSDNTYFPVDTSVAPTWIANTYYGKSTVVSAPIFTVNKYYEAVVDNYADLVAGGIEQLKSYAVSQTQTLTLEDFDCEIGDIVGGKDEVTGLRLCEPVTNIIVKLNNDLINIEYIIGGKQ